MPLIDDFEHIDRDHSLGGMQRLYSFPNGWGLSCVNSPKIHSYPFAWEIGVTWRDSLIYNTPLTNNVEVFATDDEANAFIHKAAEYFKREGP